jgi:hypothetical protein
MQGEVLIGGEFWDLIGGPRTYARWLAIYAEVGVRWRDRLVAALASL